MRSIVYAGHDFSELCSAEVVGRSVNSLVATAMEVPGRAGALPVSSRVAASDVTVRLFLDLGFKADVNGLAEARHKLAFLLCVPGGGELVLPDEPEHAYRDALLVSVGEWSKLFSDGQCDVTFTLFDPVAYGRSCVERTSSFEVGGSWAKWPEFRLVASAGDGLAVACLAQGKAISLDYTFAGGEPIVIRCEDESVEICGVDARDVVTLGSDFFSLDPGTCALAFAGCGYFETRYFERWL